MQRMITKKIFKSKVEACPVNAGHYTGKHSISFMTNLKLWLQLIQNHARHFFPIFLYTTICSSCAVPFCSSCAVQFESEQSPFSRTGCWFRSAVLASPTCPSCAGALPQELSRWFCSRNLRLSSRIAFASNCQMACRGLNLTQTWMILLPDQWVVKICCSEIPEQSEWGLILLCLLKTQKLKTAVSGYQLSSTRLQKPFSRTGCWFKSAALHKI